MQLILQRHGDSHGAAAAGVEVELAWPAPGKLALTYVVIGDIAALRLPSPAPAARVDELWRHTCLEAFIGETGGPAYYEFNHSPSTQWAAYEFRGYREGMTPVEKAGDPAISTKTNDQRFILGATLALDGLAGLHSDAAWRLALSAVIEQRNGLKSYWALAHPPGRPDFHHADGFSQVLTPAERA
ncbi:DOMON-like domain-containing protein [Phenylobacterium sp.]|uniref:DOMON-like domain-containing protein n=1 Tax=Phenylobacterium sp. TaxID=1871053 RepID=UPI0030F4622F